MWRFVGLGTRARQMIADGQDRARRVDRFPEVDG